MKSFSHPGSEAASRALGQAAGAQQLKQIEVVEMTPTQNS